MALYGQTGPHVGAEALLGVARRNPNTLNLPTDGIQGLVRVGYAVTPYLRVVGGASLTRFADQDLIVASLCPSGMTCAKGFGMIPGLGLAGLSVGLQPVLPVGPLQLRVTGLGGGYWLYHHGAALPGAATGVEGAVSLGLPIGERLRVLLEGRVVHLFGTAAAAGNSRHLGIGVALR
jgi:hypothetical protein